MNYDEALEADDITNTELFRELAKHGSSMIEYFNENDSQEFYTGEEILDWLGY